MNTITTTPKPPALPTIKDRVIFLFKKLLDDSKIDPMFKPVIRNLALKFLEGIGDREIQEGLQKVSSEIIPWLLGNEASHENTIEK